MCRCWGFDVSVAEGRRLAAIEAEVEKLAAGADRASRLLTTPIDQLTDQEAVEVVRMLCKQEPAGGQVCRVDHLDEASAIEEWRRLTR
jgi:acetolactate synthase regulatory subunit